MSQINKQHTCNKHPNNSIEFIQVKNLKEDPNKNLFYCSVCFNEDLSFKGQEYIHINQIVAEGESKILQKWPPIKDQKIIDQLIQVAGNASSHSTVEQQIINFFSMMKTEISNRIDTCQKKMVYLFKNQPFDGESILQRYQSISQILELRNLLSNCSNKDLHQKESSLRQFILSVEENKEINTKLLQDLIYQSQMKQSLMSFELPNQLKESILTFIDQIDFFDSNTINNNNNQSSLRSQNVISEKIMKLISNKSNFCSDQFLNEMRMKLKKLNPLLQSLSLENQFEQNKLPIEFDKLTQEQFEKIDHHVKHLIEIKRDEEYLKVVKNSLPLNSLKKLLDSQINLIDHNFIQQFEEYAIDTYSYLRNLHFEKMIADTHNLEEVCLLSSEMQNELLQHSIQMNRSNPNLEHQLDVQDIMSTIQLEKGRFNHGEQFLVINNQNKYKEVSNLKSNNCNCVSNIILEKDKKYIFRLQIQRNNDYQKQFMFGLMKSEDIHTKQGYDNDLSCYLQIPDTHKEYYNFPVEQEEEEDPVQIELYNTNYGISKQLKGKGFKMNLNNNEEIELRVCINEQILEVSDYPNYNYKLGVSDQCKKNLVNHKDLRLYFFPYQSEQTIILKSAVIVKQFDN